MQGISSRLLYLSQQVQDIFKNFSSKLSKSAVDVNVLRLFLYEIPRKSDEIPFKKYEMIFAHSANNLTTILLTPQSFNPSVARRQLPYLLTQQRSIRLVTSSRNSAERNLLTQQRSIRLVIFLPLLNTVQIGGLLRVSEGRTQTCLRLCRAFSPSAERSSDRGSG